MYWPASVQVPTGHWQIGHGQKWAKVGNKCSCPPGKSGQKTKWGILILKNYERTTRKQNAAKFYVLFYSFLYQQENILLLIQFSNRLWCCYCYCLLCHCLNY